MVWLQIIIYHKAIFICYYYLLFIDKLVNYYLNTTLYGVQRRCLKAWNYTACYLCTGKLPTFEGCYSGNVSFLSKFCSRQATNVTLYHETSLESAQFEVHVIGCCSESDKCTPKDDVPSMFSTIAYDNYIN